VVIVDIFITAFPRDSIALVNNSMSLVAVADVVASRAACKLASTVVILMGMIWLL
jgi:hypothetical protein